MPRAPSYNPNQIRPAQTTDARFRAADFTAATDAIAKGGNQLARAGQQYVADEDARQEHYADTFARKLALDYKKSARPLVGEYLTTQGEAAITGGPSSQAKLKELRKGLEAQASNPRMKARLAEILDAEDMDFYEAMSNHSRKAQFTLDDNTAKSEAALAADDAAANFGNPDLVKKRLGEGLAALDRRGSLNGWSSAQMDVEKRDYVSNVHISSLTGMLAGASPDVEMAAAYYSAHKDEMTAKDRITAATMLEKPLQLREYVSIFESAATGATVAPSASSQVKDGVYATPVKGSVSNTFAQHKARGSVGLDIAATQGSSVVPIAAGVVVQVSQDARAGKFIIVKHPDGHTSSYSHLGNQSVRVGDDVTPSTVIGTVGMTGNTTGPHLHLRTKDSKGRDVDPEKLIGSRAAGGTLIGPSSAARNWDKASVIANIRERGVREGWSPEKVEGAVAYANQRMGQDESTLADQRADADEQAGAVVLRLGENFKSTNQIPRDVWNKMSIADRAKYEKAADDNASGKAVEADGPASTQLKLMSILEPDKFKQTNLGAYVGKMTPAELQGLAVDQARLLKPSNNAGKPFDPSGGVREAINYGMNFGGVKLTDKDKVKVATYMTSFLRDIHEKRPLSGADYTAAFNSAVRQTSNGYMKADVLTDIPRAFRDKVMRNWKGRSPPTEDEMVTLYRRSLGG